MLENGSPKPYTLFYFIEKLYQKYGIQHRYTINIISFYGTCYEWGSIIVHTLTTRDIKTNMHHIHTSIVSRHLATRGNNKILRTPPLHISSSEEILHRLTCRTLAHLEQLNHPSSNHIYTKSTPNHIHHWLVDHKREHRTPPLARVMEVGRLQQQQQQQGSRQR